MVGAGYVGLVAAACLAERGHQVVLVDVDGARVAAVRGAHAPFREPDLDAILADPGADLTATTEPSALADAEIAILAVPTPAGPAGACDVGPLFEAIRSIAPHLRPGAVVAVKSTVPVGTTRLLQAELPDGVTVAANPEFLRQGSAVADFRRPHRVVVGSDAPEAIDKLRALYAPYVSSDRPFLATDPESAELAKYVANATLAMRVAWIDEVAALCERVGADVNALRTAVGSDPRIGRHYLAPGPGYGGSCFPKDVPALAHLAREAGHPLQLAEATQAANRAHRAALIERVLARLHGIEAPVLAIWGLAFKAGSDDLRGSLGPELVARATEEGAAVRVWDPAVTRFDGPTWAGSPIEAATGAHAVVLLTDWPELAALDLQAVVHAMRGDALDDLRNALDPATARTAGLDYRGLGRG